MIDRPPLGLLWRLWPLRAAINVLDKFPQWPAVAVFATVMAALRRLVNNVLHRLLQCGSGGILQRSLVPKPINKVPLAILWLGRFKSQGLFNRGPFLNPNLCTQSARAIFAPDRAALVANCISRKVIVLPAAPAMNANVNELLHVAAERFRQGQHRVLVSILVLLNFRVSNKDFDQWQRGKLVERGG